MGRKKQLARWVDATDVDAVLALLREDDPLGADDPELRELLQRNASLTAARHEVAGYPRISEFRKEKETGGDIGVVRQAKSILRWCNDRGVRITRWYVDNDYSASDTSRERPSYTQMFADLKASQIHGIVAWDLIRLYRQYREFQDLLDFVDDHPKTFVATAEGDLNLTNEGGRLLAGIYVLIGAMESALISKRIREKSASRARAGFWHGGFPPFGFRRMKDENGQLIPGMIEPDPVEQLAVERGYVLALKGVSIQSIARVLSAEGFKTRSGKPWGHTSVRAMLMNPANAGIRHHQPRKKYTRIPQGEAFDYAAKWEAIVDSDDHAVVRAIMLDESRRTTGLKGGHIRTFFASGLITCDRCGGFVGGKSAPNRKKPGVKQNAPENSRQRYACRKCHRLVRDRATVEMAVYKMLLAAAEAEDVAAAAAAVDDLQSTARVEVAQKLATVTAQLVEYQNEDTLARIMVDTGATLPQIAAIQGALTKQEADLRRQLVGTEGARVLPTPTKLTALWPQIGVAAQHDYLAEWLAVNDLDLVMVPLGPPRGWGRHRKPEAGLEIRKRGSWSPTDPVGEQPGEQP